MPSESQLRKRFRQCVDENAESIYRVAFRLTGTSDLANELVQETYLHAWQSLESLRDQDKMRAWIFAILRNQYSKLLKRMPRFSELKEEAIPQFLDLSEDDERQEQQQLVQEAIKRLDDEHKFPLLLVSMEGMSAESAAEVLGIPRGTVLSRLHRARIKLKTILEPQLNTISGS